jgi:histidinol-phosphate aminotransferase
MLPDGAGLVYLCNPNNPTASVTPKAAVRTFLARVPASTMVLVDEAYFHYADSGDYESVIPRIKDHPKLIVARTFSKVYGMAGLRCGYAVARPETLERLREHQAWDSVNIMALAAARASLGDSGHVERSRRLNRETREHVRAGLDAMGFRAIPSETNFLMVDLGRDVGPVIEALKQRNVHVGRRFPTLPSFLRVTIGTPAQMESFLAGLRGVMA